MSAMCIYPSKLLYNGTATYTFFSSVTKARKEKKRLSLESVDIQKTDSVYSNGFSLKSLELETNEKI